MAKQSRESCVKEKDFCICLLVFLASLMFTFHFRDEIRGMLLPKSAYNHTTGIVIESDLKTVVSRGYSSQIYHIVYKYKVRGHWYRSDKVNFWIIKTDGGIAAENAVLEKYPLNKQVLVYYQRSDPGYAVLDPYVPLTTKIGLSILLFVLFLSAYGGVWYYRAWRRAPRL